MRSATVDQDNLVAVAWTTSTGVDQLLTVEEGVADELAERLRDATDRRMLGESPPDGVVEVEGRLLLRCGDTSCVVEANQARDLADALEDVG